MEEIEKLFTEKFNMRLVKTLPVKDAYFTANLTSKGLFLNEEVSEQGTRANRTKYLYRKNS